MKYISKLPLAIGLAIIGLVGFGAVAYAADAATPGDSSSLLELLKPLYNAFAGGHYAYAAALTVIALVALTKRYLGDKFAWLHSDAGGSLMALLASSAAAYASGALTIGPGAAASFALLKSALLIGVGAAGGFAMLKNLVIEPLLKPLAAKAPAWMQPLFALVFWMFDKPSAVATAEAAGQSAVKAHPGAGLEAVAGKPTEVP